MLKKLDSVMLKCAVCYQLLESFALLRHCRRYKTSIIDGRVIANNILQNLKIQVEEFKVKYQRAPFLTAILVGENATSKLYVKNKIIAANFIGIKTDVITLSYNVEEQDLIKGIHRLNENKEVDAVLLQLPLPSHIKPSICEKISLEKDVDGFTSSNFGKFCLGMETFVPCTTLAVHKILEEIGIKANIICKCNENEEKLFMGYMIKEYQNRVNTTGKNAVVCGRSKHVGLPIAMLLHSDVKDFGCNMNTVICHRHTPREQLVGFCQKADLIVSATGIPSLIHGHMVKEGAIIIDVGISRVIDPVSGKSKVIGDVNFEEVSKIAAFITPVPGGVGPITVAMLMQNTVIAAQKRAL